MAVTFTIELDRDAVTRAQLDEVRRLVGADGDESMPPGMLAHLESETATGWRIVDVWESAEDFERFFASALGAAFDQAGFHPLAGPPAAEEVVNVLLRQRVTSYESMVRELNDAFAHNDPEPFDRHLHPDFVDHEEMPGIPPTREGVKQLMATMNATFGGFTIDTLDVVSGPGRAACRSRLRGRHLGEFMGIPATGREVDVEAIDYFTIDDEGLVREHWGQFDQGAFMAQLGLPVQAGAPTVEQQQAPTQT